MPPRLKVLICSYACDPNFGSEPGMGWNFVSNIARFHEVHVIVEEHEFRENLTRYAAEHPEEVRNITFHYIPRTHHNLLRKIWPPSYYWFYRKWLRKAYQLAVKLDKQENFDLVHQLTLAGYREPGYLWKLGKPLVWGPIGGLNNTAWCLIRGLDWHSKLYFTCRNLLNSLQMRFSYAARTFSRRAGAILVCDPSALPDIEKLWHRKAEVMREIGIHENNTCPTPAKHSPDQALKICWVGSLMRLKGLEMILEALAHCQANVQLEVIGQGPMEEEWQKLARKLQVEHKVTFHGFMPHDRVLPFMQQCHVFCSSSIKEGGTATVTLEALCCGLPLVALNHCGFASVIDDSCGIRIPILSRQQIVADFAAAFDKLATDESYRFSLACGSLQRSRIFSWEEKIAHLNNVYEAVQSQSR